MNDIINYAQPLNEKVIAQKKQLHQPSQLDPDNKDHEYFEVIKSSNTDLIEPGDCFSASSRTMLERTINGVIIFICRIDQIDFKITKENVKKSLSK